MRNIFFSVLFFVFSLFSLGFANPIDNPILVLEGSGNEKCEITLKSKGQEGKDDVVNLRFKIHWDVLENTPKKGVILAIPYELSIRIQTNEDIYEAICPDEYAKTLDEEFTKFIFSLENSKLQLHIKNYEKYIQEVQQIISNSRCSKNGEPIHCDFVKEVTNHEITQFLQKILNCEQDFSGATENDEEYIQRFLEQRFSESELLVMEEVITQYENGMIFINEQKTIRTISDPTIFGFYSSKIWFDPVMQSVNRTATSIQGFTNQEHFELNISSPDFSHTLGKSERSVRPLHSQ